LTFNNTLWLSTNLGHVKIQKHLGLLDCQNSYLTTKFWLGIQTHDLTDKIWRNIGSLILNLKDTRPNQYNPDWCNIWSVRHYTLFLHTRACFKIEMYLPRKKPQQQNFAKYAKDKKQSDAKSKVRISKSSNFYWLGVK